MTCHFLELRKNTGDDRRRCHDMNTANWIPDLFMKRMEARGDWTFFRSITMQLTFIICTEKDLRSGMRLMKRKPRRVRFGAMEYPAS